MSNNVDPTPRPAWRYKIIDRSRKVLKRGFVSRSELARLRERGMTDTEVGERILQDYQIGLINKFGEAPQDLRLQLDIEEFYVCRVPGRMKLIGGKHGSPNRKH